ncbi:hypothetical protein LMG28138_05925 [Pararobbsia alpina]|uniref:SpoVT-AbrB domain-containing protein n=1 Tax=Pararobbsia alpina TaxID=621374 RepID=A0A6S7BQ68_9BURK|nr:hypothetical protein LMG28138_05925 [Pararobbsia alpina]
MASATITSKGQVTIPVGVRSDLGLGPETESNSSSTRPPDATSWCLQRNPLNHSRVLSGSRLSLCPLKI